MSLSEKTSERNDEFNTQPPERRLADVFFQGLVLVGGLALTGTVYAALSLYKNALLLENMPGLFLALGGALTLMGTLCVHNSRRHATRLAQMSAAMIQKNNDLSREVLERERLNEILSKAEHEYRAVIDAVTDIIFETDTDGNILFVNALWQKVTGFDPEQVLGRNLFDLCHPQDQEEQRGSFRALVRGQKAAYRSFTRLRTAAGSFRAVELAVSMLRRDEHQALRVVGTITDVEERRRAERALSEAEKKYRVMVENAAAGIYQVTPEGQFLSANPAMGHILGFDTVDGLLRSARDAFSLMFASAREKAGYARLLESEGTLTNMETQARTRDGNTIWVNHNARAVREDEGPILYYEGSVEDITQRKEFEMTLRKAKIDSDLASRAKSEFLANMSHELRTPLNAIIGFSELIKNEVFGAVNPPQYKDYANDIYVSGKSLLTIINEILDVARVDAGQRQLNESMVNMNKVVASCIEFVQFRAAEKKLTLAPPSGAAMPVVVGEEVAIRQMVLNLLSNAIKFTHEGGVISVSHEIDFDGGLRISVTDTGIGMSEPEIEKALSLFGQVEAAFNRSASGAGLGLTLVNSLINLHEGQLEMLSRKGVGTTATLIFPARRVVREGEGEGEAIR